MKNFLLLPLLLLISVNASAAVVAFVNSTEGLIEIIYQTCYMENGRERRCLEQESVIIPRKHEVSEKEIAVRDGLVARVRVIKIFVNDIKPIYFPSCRMELARNNILRAFKLVEAPISYFKCYVGV